MNSNYLTLDEDSPAVLRGCLWALATAATLTLFVMLMWIDGLRAGLAAEKRDRIMAEMDRDTAVRESNAAIQSLNARLASAASEYMNAENQMQIALQAKAQAEAELAQAKAQCDQDERVVTYLRAALARSR